MKNISLTIRRCVKSLWTTLAAFAYVTNVYKTHTYVPATGVMYLQNDEGEESNCDNCGCRGSEE